MRGWSYNVLYVYRRTTNDNDDDDARQNPSRGLFSTLVREKKNKKVTQKVIFHPFAQKSSVNGFFTKFGTYVPLVDIINPDKVCVNLFKGFDFTGVQNFHFPIGN